MIRVVDEYWHPSKPDASLEETRTRRASTYDIDMGRAAVLAAEADGERQQVGEGGSPSGRPEGGGDVEMESGNRPRRAADS